MTRKPADVALFEETAAFDLWLNQGPKRSYATVAKIMKVRPEHIHRLAVKGKWEERLDVVRKDTERRVQNFVVESFSASKIKYVGAIQKLVDDFSAKVDSGDVVIRKAGDFEKLVKLHTLLEQLPEVGKEDEYAKMSLGEIQAELDGVKKRRTSADELMLERFKRGVTPPAASGAGSEPAAGTEPADPLHSASEAGTFSPVSRKSASHVWRESGGEIDDRDSGGLLSLHRILPGVVSKGESASSA